MRRFLLLTTSALLIAGIIVAAPAAAQDDELQKQLDEIKKGQDEIRAELAELKRLIQRPTPRPAARPSGPAVEGKVFDLAANPVKGLPDARLTLIEFLDYQ